MAHVHSVCLQHTLILVLTDYRVQPQKRYLETTQKVFVKGFSNYCNYNNR